MKIVKTCMNTKLTLTLQKEIIDQAKKFASEKGRGLSEIVENYFKFLIEAKAEEKVENLSPRIKKLRGIIKASPGFDYRKVLDAERSKKHNV